MRRAGALSVPALEDSSYFYFISDVQFGQRVALIGMTLKQYGQSFVVGSAGGGAFFRLLKPLMIRKITKATITKSITVCRNTPHLTIASPTVSVFSVKSTPPIA